MVEMVLDYQNFSWVSQGFKVRIWVLRPDLNSTLERAGARWKLRIWFQLTCILMLETSSRVSSCWRPADVYPHAGDQLTCILMLETSSRVSSCWRPAHVYPHAGDNDIPSVSPCDAETFYQNFRLSLGGTVSENPERPNPDPYKNYWKTKYFD